MACSSSSSPPDTIGTSSSTPSTSTTEHHHIYDVFINHRGPDVKKTFASHLYHRLLSSGLQVFLDQEELQQGENLTSQIEGAIATASVHVAIFSRGYAESNWCLDELVLMLKSGTPIIPVFYGVKPAELRWTQSKVRVSGNLLRTLVWWPLGIHDMFAKIRRILGWWTRRKDGTYEHALLNLGKKKTIDPQTNEEKPRYEANAIENWRNALSRVAEISGFELEACNSDEGRLLNKVVEQVLRKVRKTPLNVATYPTGLKEKLEDLDKMVSLQQQSGGAQVVGIVGLGGIGKTTLAKEFFNSRRTSYSASCFLFDFREAAGKGSLPSLQTELVRCLKQLELSQVRSIDEGIGLLKAYLSFSRALIILDDVDHPSQLEALFLPVKDILFPGSLIVVTSRDKDLLTVSGIVESSIYKITGLNRRHSLELFCSHAFNQPYPFVGFEEVVAQFLHACEGLPLSLKVIGALLRGKEDLEYWKYQLSKISKVLPSDIQSRLKISYDSLDEEEKEIFLDIVCFFVGQDRDMVIRIWEGSLGIRNLENKCLVQVDSGNRIRMHDHIRDMGRSLAEKEPPGYLRRLWRPIDNLTLQNVPHQSSVRGICLVERNSESSVELNRTVVDMSKLQLLRAEGDCLQSIFSQGRSPDLIWLCWDKCPYPFLPSWLPIRKLRVLQFQSWFGGEITEQFQSFWQSESQLPLELRELSFQGPLSKLPDSIGQLKQLEKIELRDGRMIFLPYSFGHLTNLQFLDLSWSSSLQELPDSFGNLIRLKHLCLAGCSELSISQGTLGNITTLVSLDLSFCLKMNELPPQVARQRFLKELNLLGTSLRVLTRDIGELGRLETLKLGSPSVKMLPPSLGDLTSLKELTLYGCKKLKCLPESVGELTSLKELTLSECTSLECLPESVGELKQLTRLDISGSLIKYLPMGITEMNNLEYLNIHSTPLLYWRAMPFGNSEIRKSFRENVAGFTR